MRRLPEILTVIVATAVVGLVVPAPGEAADCPRDAVRAGTVCFDKYEASLWQIKPQGSATSLSKEQQSVVDSIRAGNVTLADLNKIGAVQLGLNPAFPQQELAAAGCAISGNGCTNVYAVSLPGVKPAGFVTWFQAAAAARNSFKRLPTNAEWTVAAMGTPDAVADDGSTTCNVSSHLIVNAGSRRTCVSDVGVFDMVGNLIEWVADWVPRSDDSAASCGAGGANAWDTGGGFDGHGYQCLVGASTTGDPGALWRGGGTADGADNAGVFAISGLNSPNTFDFALGFHAVR